MLTSTASEYEDVHGAAPAWTSSRCVLRCLRTEDKPPWTYSTIQPLGAIRRNSRSRKSR
ncbi:hypothetical protein TR2A62_3710, partial [Thalassobium sp. R2A62]